MSWLAVAVSFNLLCGGGLQTTSIAGTTNEPFSIEYRFDLDRKLFCEGECKAQSAIVDVQPTTLILADKNVDTLSEQSTTSMRIDRENGSISGLYTYKNPRNRASVLLMKWVGTCERKPFSGFPKVDTKF